jgi:putative transposase
VSQKRIARRMKFLGLRSIIVKKFNHSTSSKTNDKKEYKNLLKQDFFADKPCKKWVGDITYIYTNEIGWTYLAIVMDLFDLKIVGWSYDLNMTDDLVIEAFNRAMINRGINEDGLFHSDRGSQYTSNDFEKLLEKLKIKHSYSKKGYPYDNASMESFNAILKKEEVNVNNYETFNEAKLAIFEFIEGWYNNQRIHSTLGYITPNEKYNNYIASLALA